MVPCVGLWVVWRGERVKRGLVCGREAVGVVVGGRDVVGGVVPG